MFKWYGSVWAPLVCWVTCRKARHRLGTRSIMPHHQQHILLPFKFSLHCESNGYVHVSPYSTILCPLVANYVSKYIKAARLKSQISFIPPLQIKGLSCLCWWHLHACKIICDRKKRNKWLNMQKCSPVDDMSASRWPLHSDLSTDTSLDQLGSIYTYIHQLGFHLYSRQEPTRVHAGWKGLILFFSVNIQPVATSCADNW